MAGDPFPWNNPQFYNPFPMPSISSSAVTEAITQVFGKSIREVVLYEQLNALIERHLDETRDIYITCDEERSFARVWKAGLELFSSVSYIACIEWALKQPMKA